MKWRFKNLGLQTTVFLYVVLYSASLLAHTAKTRAGFYRDNNDLSRNLNEIGLDLKFDAWESGITNHAYTLRASQDHYKREFDTHSTDATGDHKNNSVSLGFAQTFNKTLELRQSLAQSTDDELGVKTRSFGGGAGIWFWQDTLRLSLDAQRSLTTQPVQEYLDYDSELVSVPQGLSSTNLVATMRHLATTTTIVDYTFGNLKADNRPVSNLYGLNIKQFIPQLSGAVHVGVSHAVNRGKINPNTTYGQVDAWEINSAYLQSLWGGAQGRLGYRYYKENQTTRAYGDELVFGSDMYSVSLSQEFSNAYFELYGLDYPIILDASASVYRTNKDNTSVVFDNDKRIFARIYELALSTKF